MQPLNSQPPAPGHPDWDGQADARRPRPWLAPGMWHPRIPLSSRMSRAARAASPVRDPPGAALTWVRRCLAAWEGRERPYQGASGRQPALSSGGGGPFAGATQGPEHVRGASGTPYGGAPTTLTPASEVMHAVQRRPSAPGAWLCAQGGWQVARCRLGGPRRRPPPRAHGGWWSGLLCRAGRRLTRRFGVLAGGLSEAESMSRRRRC